MQSLAPQDRLLGRTIATRYRVVGLIGSGGMGTVYEVEHIRLGRRFALKCLKADLAEDDDSVSRFRREADTVAKLRHPGIVEVFDCETLEDGSPCLVMELLVGESLGARVARQGCQRWGAIARIGDSVLSALSAAHSAGVVHRDLKPANIFLVRDGDGDERVKLIDFGLSKIRGDNHTLTTDARLLGTPAYMSPEQAEGRAVGSATDVWACGAILHYLATGRHAFTGINVPGILYRICHGQPDPLLARRPDAPSGFVEVVSGALQRDPMERIGSADELRRLLSASMRGHALDEETTGIYSEPATDVDLARPPFDESPYEVTTLSGSAGVTYPRWMPKLAGARVVVVSGLAALCVAAIALVRSGSSPDLPSSVRDQAALARPAAPTRLSPSVTLPAPPVRPAALPAAKVSGEVARPVATDAGARRRIQRPGRRAAGPRRGRVAPARRVAPAPAPPAPPRARAAPIGDGVVDPPLLGEQ